MGSGALNLAEGRGILRGMPAPVRTEALYDLPFPREKVWPIFSKTDWLNRSLGLPPVQYRTEPLPEGGAAIFALARVFGQELRWRELPFEWSEPNYYWVRREFTSGPLLEFRGGVEFLEANGGATRLKVFSEFRPRHRFGAWLARNVLARKATRDFASVVKHVAAHWEDPPPVPLPNLARSPVSEPALEAGLARLRKANQPAELLQRVRELIRDWPDVQVGRIRPLAAARQWGRDDWEVVRCFLHGTRAGLFDLSWEILCPNCRSAPKEVVKELSGLRRRVHCDACQIDYDAEFDRSVELKFAVNPAVRSAPAETYCLAGPGGKPHVVQQLVLRPGEVRELSSRAVETDHRLRSAQVGASALIRAGECFGAPGQQIVCTKECFDIRRGEGTAPGKITNPHSYPVVVSLERAEWSADILTAARITNWQEFRDIFAREVVSPGEEVKVGCQIILFTDLRGSTSLYREVGDAPAYALVRDHFAVVTEVLRAHRGALVKTIGDAVMAVFGKLDEALEGVLEMHDRLAGAPFAGGKLILKSALHVGPCLAVNANDKLDFFGTTINLAARLVSASKGNDLVVSEEIFQRSETSEFLRRFGKTAEPAALTFRGFDQPAPVWRIQLQAVKNAELASGSTAAVERASQRIS